MPIVAPVLSPSVEDQDVDQDVEFLIPSPAPYLDAAMFPIMMTMY